MPSNFTAQANYRAKLIRKSLAQTATARQIDRGQAPFLGYTPDLPAHLAGMAGAQDCSGLIADVLPGFGLVLRPDFGFTKYDPKPTKLPLGDSVLPASPTTDARPVLRLDSFIRRTIAFTSSGDQTTTLMAITEGDPSAGPPIPGRLYRVNPQTAPNGEWELITSTAGAAATATRDGNTNVAKSMPDSFTVPFGISGTINAPVWVWCNNLDHVYIYPNAAGAGGSYTDYPDGGGGLAGFKARSGCVWINRVWFLNTEENGTRRRTRLRGSAALNGQIALATPGIVAIDFTDFDGEGVAVRPLGDHLACYFQDGVGLVLRPTGSQAPISTRVITRERGLLSTHGVTTIGSSEHFGIFTDGWYILNAGGQFREVGLFSAGSQTLHTFRDTFYNDLDEDRIHEIQVQYEPRTRYVRVAWPKKGVTNAVVWTLDIHTGAVWPMDWTAVCFGVHPIQTAAAGTIDGLTARSPTIDGLSGVAPTIDALGASAFGLEAILHGGENGNVYLHDQTTRLRDGVQASWNYRTHLIPGDNFLNLHTIDRTVLEYVMSDLLTVRLGVGTESQNHSVPLTLNSTTNEISTVFAWHRLTGTHRRFRFFGSGDIQVRGYEMWSHLHRGERRGPVI